VAAPREPRVRRGAARDLLRPAAEADPDGARVRYALEFRSPTFDHPECYALLREHRVATVLADAAGRWPRVERDTADFRYVRLHGDRELYTSGYDDAALDRWAEKIRRWRKDTYVYFDNDAKGYAPHDAMRLIRRLGRDTR
jgi:uncharacterized protein YecE (DUF72 family)